MPGEKVLLMIYDDQRRFGDKRMSASFKIMESCLLRDELMGRGWLSASSIDGDGYNR